MIALEEVDAGDEVIITDRCGNRVSGTVILRDHAASVMAFGVEIPFAKRIQTGGLRKLTGVSVIGHTPVLV